MLNMNQINETCRILSAGMANLSEQGLPWEAAEGLKSAKEQMWNLPEVVNDIRQAMEKQQNLNQTIETMISLAEEAARLENGEQPQYRQHLQDRFECLAKIVAHEAGRNFYGGPEMNLRNQGEALSAARMLKYMRPVMQNTMDRFNEQNALIAEAVTETINFLEIILKCYPDAESAGSMESMLKALIKPQMGLPVPATARH